MRGNVCAAESMIATPGMLETWHPLAKPTGWTRGTKTAEMSHNLPSMCLKQCGPLKNRASKLATEIPGLPPGTSAIPAC